QRPTTAAAARARRRDLEEKLATVISGSRARSLSPVSGRRRTATIPRSGAAHPSFWRTQPRNPAVPGFGSPGAGFPTPGRRRRHSRRPIQDEGQSWNRLDARSAGGLIQHLLTRGAVSDGQPESPESHEGQEEPSGVDPNRDENPATQ